MATPTTNLSKGVPKDAASFRNAAREMRRPVSEGCVKNDIVGGLKKVHVVWLMRSMRVSPIYRTLAVVGLTTSKILSMLSLPSKWQ
jgi:hypothetical protein